MALTIAQKSNVRRHLKFPAVGLNRISPAGQNFAAGSAGYRFFQAYGLLEYKLNNLNPDEEARLLGRAFAAAALVGAQPIQGDVITVTLSGGQIGSPQTLSATAGAQTPNIDGRLPMIKDLAAACSNNAVLQNAGVIGLAPYGTGPFSQSEIPVPEVAFSAPTTFQIAVGGAGTLLPQITADGSLLEPSTTLDGVNTIYGYIPILNGLESAYASTSQNLDTKKADVWTARGNEAGQRRSLYENWVQLLSDFIGVPINPNHKAQPGSTGALRYA